MKVQLPTGTRFLACPLPEAEVTNVREGLYRLTYSNGFRQIIKQSEYDAIMMVKNNGINAEIKEDTKVDVIEPVDDGLEAKKNKELFEIMREYYVDSKMMNKMDMVRLIREARQKR